MLDYQVIPVPGEPSLDLVGFHVMHRLADWMYLGVGGYAPLNKGAYGGFMAFDVTAHAQRRLWGPLYANAGLSFGGGGGGKSKEQSKVLSGTGGFVKGYAGLGYEFDDFSLGANVAWMKFKRSVIDSTQLNVFVQLPFTYTIGSYASFGDRLSADETKGFFGSASENTLTWGLDNFVQIDPKGSNKSTIRLADLQFAHYMTGHTYWYASLGVGVSGLPLYNHVIGGIGYRYRLSPRVNLHAQLGLGSGGYAPETMDTGAGLLVYPKMTAEYMIAKNLGLALSAGYMFAPKGSSKNNTFGAALNYQIQSGGKGRTAVEAAEGILLKGYRFSLFQQTESKVNVRGLDRAPIQLLSGQLDTLVSEHVYIPLQAAVAYTAYLDYPGYGELLAGVGVQNRYSKDDRLQVFGQLLVGTNVHGPVLKAGVGLNYGLGDRLALYAAAGKTREVGSNDTKFSADYVGLGMTYRFSVPSW